MTRYKVTSHPESPLSEKTKIVEADGFDKTSTGIAFWTEPKSDPARPFGASLKQTVAWFDKLTAVEIAPEEPAKEEPKTPPALTSK